MESSVGTGPGLSRKFSYLVATSLGAAAGADGGGPLCDMQLVTSVDSGLMLNSGASNANGGFFEKEEVSRSSSSSNKRPKSRVSTSNSNSNRVVDDAGSSVGAHSTGGGSVASARSAKSTRSQHVKLDQIETC